METATARALVAGARAFADALEQELGLGDSLDPAPTPGSAESKRILLRGVADVNDQQHRGATQEELSTFAGEAGMDPRDTAGCYRADDKALLDNRPDSGRWITTFGRERLKRLKAT